MKIVDFTAAHAGRAAQIALENYGEERGFVPALPPVAQIPDLTGFAANGLGVAALDGDTVIGFLCGCDVWDNAWGIPGLRHVFSPMHANGAVSENRAKIYARLYQTAGEKWAGAGAASHAVCLYAHDQEALEQFYRYGFGMRCVDAIRDMDEIAAPACDAYEFSDLAPEDVLDVLPLENKLKQGFIDSPFFMYREPSGKADFIKDYGRFRSVCIVAKYDGAIVAFIRAELDGETFIRDTPGYLHCEGLYCLPEHRGTGVSQTLLGLLIRKLRTLGYTRLGVDFESINPSGSGFWLKYFTAYTHGVVRRIDERAVTCVGTTAPVVPTPMNPPR